MGEALARANAANAQEQQGQSADSTMDGFAAGKGAVPQGSIDFDRAVVSAINRGASPSKAIALARAALGEMPRDTQTASTALASGRGADTLLSSAGNSRVFQIALGNALAKGVPIDKALVLARKVEDASAFRFPVAAAVAKLAGTRNVKIDVTLADGKPLPSWLWYAADTKSFVAVDVPQGGFPLPVLIKVAGQQVRLTITEGPSKL